LARFYHIGLDDTDSSDGMCTTYLAYCIVRRLIRQSSRREKTSLVDYPNLIRLNPNIPWKTRGNAALALRLKSNLDRETLFRLCSRFLRAHATSPRANSGLVVYEGQDIPVEVKEFSERALHKVLGKREAYSLLGKFGMRWLALRSRQGIVGALAAIGNTLEGDHTFELISYRRRVEIAREIDADRIVKMDRSTRPSTFSSYDPETGRIMIMPRGPDPVLCGVRGESASSVRRAFSMLLPIKNLEGWMIFRSNQGTGEHLHHELKLDDAKVYSSGFLRGVLKSNPRIERGGHIFFKLSNGEGEIECACYQPARNLRKNVLSLIPGDMIEIAGGVRKPTRKHSRVLNMEYLLPLKLATEVKFENPLCTKCFSRMASRGRGQGYECRRCGHIARDAVKIMLEQPRSGVIEEGKMYLPPLGAQRHLTKPLQRYGLPMQVDRRIVPPTGKWIKL